MSFLIDPPLLLLSGLAIYLLGKRMKWSRHAKIVIGLAIALIFIIFSALLYMDIIRCTFPFFSRLSGSEFMFHSNITRITKSMVPEIVVLFLFLLYPVWIFAGYASALLIEKRRRISPEIYTYSDVKSKKRNKGVNNGSNGSNAITGANSSISSAGTITNSRIDRTLTLPSAYVVKRGKDTRKCVIEAIDSLGGIGKFVQNGDKVLVKVNICGGVPEKIGTFTSIEVADVLADLIISAGAEPIVADADMVWVKFCQAATDSGYVEWAKKKGVRLVNLSETKIVNFDFGPDSALGMEKVSMETIDADVIISVPTMKTHLLTGVTLAMKNMYGTFPDIDKAKYHKKSIEDTIIEVNSAFTPNLVALGCAIGYYWDGYIWRSSLLFELSFLMAIVVAALAAVRMKTVHLIALLAISALVCYVVEHTNISAGLLKYAGSADVSLFTISGWIVMIVVILQLSDFLTSWLKGLAIFKEIRAGSSFPLL